MKHTDEKTPSHTYLKIIQFARCILKNKIFNKNKMVIFIYDLKR